MTLLLRASELINLPVVTIDDGEAVAEVRDVVFGSRGGRILGFTLNRRGLLRGRHGDVLPIDDVAAIGSDAVMITTETKLVPERKAPAPVATADPQRDVLGDPVITDGGTKLGVVRDLVLLVGGSGEVVGYEFEREGTKERWFVPRPAQVSVSGDALVVPADIEHFIRHDLVGFGAAIREYRRDHATDTRWEVS